MLFPRLPNGGREAGHAQTRFSHPNISFFHLPSVIFNDPLPSLYWWAGRNLNGAPSANEPANDHILIHTVRLKPMIKAHSSGRMVSSGISDVVIASVYFEKTRQKKLMMMEIIIIMIIYE